MSIISFKQISGDIKAVVAAKPPATLEWVAVATGHAGREVGQQHRCHWRGTSRVRSSRELLRTPRALVWRAQAQPGRVQRCRRREEVGGSGGRHAEGSREGLVQASWALASLKWACASCLPRPTWATISSRHTIRADGHTGGVGNNLRKDKHRITRLPPPLTEHGLSASITQR